MEKDWPQNVQTVCTDLFRIFIFLKALNRLIQHTLPNLAPLDVVFLGPVGGEVRPVADGAVAAHPWGEVPGEGPGDQARS